ncbi:FkbM family methyltransferase [Formosa sp. S-31]|uniref:FkbM family methyltransferase n=1 Tax=Formosa sp. S-31 TaxID=2790949 RepID=UPI003EBDC8EC
MKKLLYNFVSWFVKLIAKRKVVMKPVKGFNKVLYYEKAQHLNFLFQKEANYEPHLLKRITPYICPGARIFDIGANIGQYTLIFSELVGEAGEILSFEPDFKNFAFLQFNTTINACKNVRCYNYGIGSEDTRRQFFRDTETGGRKGSFNKEYVENSFKGYTDEVQIKGLDTVIDEFGIPDFVKIDTEGFELEIISGLKRELEHCVFFIEVEDNSIFKVFDYFNTRGFTCLCIDKEPQEITDAKMIKRNANLIFKKG